MGELPHLIFLPAFVDILLLKILLVKLSVRAIKTRAKCANSTYMNDNHNIAVHADDTAVKSLTSKFLVVIDIMTKHCRSYFGTTPMSVYRLFRGLLAYGLVCRDPYWTTASERIRICTRGVLRLRDSGELF